MRDITPRTPRACASRIRASRVAYARESSRASRSHRVRVRVRIAFASVVPRTTAFFGAARARRDGAMRVAPIVAFALSVNIVDGVAERASRSATSTTSAADDPYLFSWGYGVHRICVCIV